MKKSETEIKSNADQSVKNAGKVKLSEKASLSRGFGEDDAFCTAAGAMSPKPSSKYEKGKLRSLLNECDRA